MKRAMASKVNAKGRNDSEQYVKLSYRMLRSDAWRSLPPLPRPPIETRQPTLDELIELQPKPSDGGRRDRI